jgi:hypothetical protein
MGYQAAHDLMWTDPGSTFGERGTDEQLRAATRGRAVLPVFAPLTPTRVLETCEPAARRCRPATLPATTTPPHRPAMTPRAVHSRRSTEDRPQ